VLPSDGATSSGWMRISQEASLKYLRTDTNKGLPGLQKEPGAKLPLGTSSSSGAQLMAGTKRHIIILCTREILLQAADKAC
jgi:hypothetical protein